MPNGSNGEWSGPGGRRFFIRTFLNRRQRPFGLNITTNDYDSKGGVTEGFFSRLWQIVSDTIPPQEAENLAEDLGIEMDTAEHILLERGPLCTAKTHNPLKRKR